MNGLIALLRRTPSVSRVAPFVIFAALTSAQGQFDEASRYWFYLAKTFVGAWLIWAVWPVVTEMRWKFSLEAVGVGVGVIVMWIGIDSLYPKILGQSTPWNPHRQFGEGSALAWLFIVVRVLGSTLVVPCMEEMFYRSFVYRYVIQPNFEAVSLQKFHKISFLVTSILFGLVHYEWLAGILCGFAYQYLVLKHGRLGEAMTAHAVSNLLLGFWVIFKGAWNFW